MKASTSVVLALVILLLMGFVLMVKNSHDVPEGWGLTGTDAGVRK